MYVHKIYRRAGIDWASLKEKWDWEGPFLGLLIHYRGKFLNIKSNLKDVFKKQKAMNYLKKSIFLKKKTNFILRFGNFWKFR